MTSRRKKWLQASAWLVFIYATLPFARPVCEYLRKTIPFSFVINVTMVACLAVVILVLFRFLRLQKLSSYLILSLMIACYLSLLWIIKIPEERIHFFEYGILAVFIERALRIKRKALLTYLVTIILTIVFGWLDEVIQHYLPGRYFGWQDVLYNAMGGILGVVLVYVVQRETLNNEMSS